MVLLHLLAIIVLACSGLPLMIKLSLGGGLALYFIYIMRSKLPLPQYQKLSYQLGHWLLHMTNGRQIKYEQATIGFEGGLFVLLNLTGSSPGKTLVVFKDQVTVEQYRILKFIG